MIFALVALSATLAQATTTTAKDANMPCQTMASLYNNGEDLCNTMFGESFLYVAKSDPKYDMAYTMWFFTSDNPNDATTQKRVDAQLHPIYNTTDKCWLAGETTDHKKVPSAEGDGFTECYPYKQNGCCDEATVEDAFTMNNKYGPEWRWDVCGKMSQECERFMVQEACFYECDPNVGLFRQYPPMLNGKTRANETGMEWYIYKVPIKGDYCDAWWQACREDLFCAVGDGDIYQCSAYYEKHNPPAPYSAGEIAGIVIGSIAICCLLSTVFCLISRERKGKPVFGIQGLGEEKSNLNTPQQQPQQQQQRDIDESNIMVI